MTSIGAQENPHNKKQEPYCQDITLLNLQSVLSDNSLNNMFESVLSPITDILGNISYDLKVDYHIVLLDRKSQKRYSIIEGKKATIDSKPIKYGVVGALFENTRKNNKSLFAQFQYNDNSPKNAYIYENDKLTMISTDDYDDIFPLYNKPIWDVNNKIFAIATTLIKRDAKVIGACSIDFTTKTENYPAFVFRENEINFIFKVLYVIKNLFANCNNKLDTPW